MNYKDELEFARDLALEAGKIASGYFKSEYEVTQKGEDNPLTTADLEVNSCIEKAVKERYPADGWLSEETRDSADRLSCSRTWIVDPIDGTKEFIKGLPEFCISIALSVDGKCILGVLHNPATGELFYGAEGEGVFDGDGNSIRVLAPPTEGKPELVASRSEITKGLFGPLEDVYTLTPTGSVAYKLGLIAAGRYHMNISLVPKNEWDVAAGIALVELAGGRVLDLNEKPYIFNQKVTLNEGIIAGHPELVDRYLEIRKSLT